MGFLPNRLYEPSQAAGQSQLAQYSLPTEINSGLLAADAAGFNSLSDVAWWLDHSGGRGRSIFVGMSPGPFSPLPDSDREVALFVGNKTGPNISGLNWFLQEIWPTVMRARPHAMLHVVGRVAAWVEGDHAGVELIGEVDDIEREYSDARVVVLPLTTGSAGVKTKLVEAIMFGRPFVGTSVAIEPEHVDVFSKCGYVADTAANFATAVASLLGDDADRREKQASTRLAYDRLYSNDAAYRDISSWLDGKKQYE
jgi:succinoglycan biosynthesis protein ExoO